MAMDTARYSIRPFADADYEEEARIKAEVDPEFSNTASEIRHYTEVRESEPGHLTLKLVAETRDTRKVVAYGEVAHSLFNFHPQRMWIEVGVEAASRRQGIGSELYSRLEREAVVRGAAVLWTAFREGEVEGKRLFDHRGFQERRRVWTSRLDLKKFDLGSLPDRRRELESEGLRFASLDSEGSEREEVRKRLYELSVVASKDVPRLGEYRPPPFGVFLQFSVEAPGVMKDGYFLAASGEQYVGLTSLEREPSREDTLRVGFTGTRPEFRSRGIAAQLKRMSVEYARSKGFRYLVTSNDSLNRPMWKINERMGFRPELTWVNGEKLLASSQA
jgi:GNAT superfamily N-acetyltransferase